MPQLFKFGAVIEEHSRYAPAPVPNRVFQSRAAGNGAAPSLNVRTSKNQCFGNFNIVAAGRVVKRGFSNFLFGSFGSGVWIRASCEEHLHYHWTVGEKSRPIGDNMQERFRSTGIPNLSRRKSGIGSNYFLKRIKVALFDRTKYFTCQWIVFTQDHSRSNKTILSR